ncbi:uncharacterized protein LOC141815854 [Curcuma longa]|uniref:uncharacterized protein LOC141815854 n=1 Tax=Curcuma longa TaxID=136217 RepID=UPI003D9E49A0
MTNSQIPTAKPKPFAFAFLLFPRASERSGGERRQNELPGGGNTSPHSSRINYAKDDAALAEARRRTLITNRSQRKGIRQVRNGSITTPKLGRSASACITSSSGGINFNQEKMEGSFNQQILADELAKLYNSQRQIDDLSSWCIGYKQNAKQVVEIWLRQLLSCPREQKIVAFLYLANEVLRKSGKNGIEFINEFWKVLPKALSFALGKGDESAKAVLKLVCIWEEHQFFGSKSKQLREKIAMIISETRKMDEKAKLEDARKINEKTKLEMKTAQFHHLLEAAVSRQMKTGTGISAEMEAKPTSSRSSAKLQNLLFSLVSAGVIGLGESPAAKKKLKTDSNTSSQVPTSEPLPQPPVQLVSHLQNSRMELPPLPPLPFPSTKPIASSTQTLLIQTSAGSSKGVPSRYNSSPSPLSNYPTMGKHSDPYSLNSHHSFLVMEGHNLSVQPPSQMVPPLPLLAREERICYLKSLVANYGRMPK